MTTFRADSSRPVVILGAGVQVLTLIGSKLTTCREVAELILDEGSQKNLVRSDSRIVPGGENWPDSPDAIEQHLRQLSAQYDLTETLTLTVWSLIENRFDELAWFLAEPGRRHRHSARWSIPHEFATRLDDLVERRLMLTISSRLCRANLGELAAQLMAAGHLKPHEVEVTIDEATKRLRHYYGKSLTQLPDRTPDGYR